MFRHTYPRSKQRERLISGSSHVGERMKSAFLKSEAAATSRSDDSSDSPNEYAREQIRYGAEVVAQRSGHYFGNGYRYLRSARRRVLEKQAVKEAGKAAKKARAAGQAAAKTAQRTAAAAKLAAKAAAEAAKLTAAAAKAVVEGTKDLIAAIAAGGGVAIIAVIVVICVCGILVASPLAIFLTGSAASTNSVSAATAVRQINEDFESTLESRARGNYDRIEISGTAADWPEILAVFAVKVAGRNDADVMDVATLDHRRVRNLKKVFWDMTDISTRAEVIVHPDSNPNDNVDDSWREKVLWVVVISKSAEDMKRQYRFNDRQCRELDEILSQREDLLRLICGAT